MPVPCPADNDGGLEVVQGAAISAAPDRRPPHDNDHRFERQQNVQYKAQGKGSDADQEVCSRQVRQKEQSQPWQHHTDQQGLQTPELDHAHEFYRWSNNQRTHGCDWLAGPQYAWVAGWHGEEETGPGSGSPPRRTTVCVAIPTTFSAMAASITIAATPILRALARRTGLTPAEAEPYVHDVLNVFMCTGVTRDTGQYFMKASPVRLGDYLEFFAEIDLLRCLSACPGGDCSPRTLLRHVDMPSANCRSLETESHAS